MTDRPVDTVLFDLDDTLVTYRRSSGEVLADAFEAVGVDPFFEVEAYYERYESFLREHDSIRDLRRACFRDIADGCGHDGDLADRVADAFHDLRDPTAVDLLPGAEEVLDALTADHRLGVVTNGTPDVQRPKIEAAGLGDRFETIVFAGHDTAPKPDPEPFDRALDALDGVPERAIHVGNSLGSDVAGAHAAGLQSAWIPAYEEDHAAEPHYALESLHDLLSPPWM